LLQPQPFSLRDGTHYGSLFSLSTSTTQHSKTPYPFADFVSTVFHLRDITLPIHSFILNCWQSDPHDINRFVYDAVQRRGIENLHIKMFARVPLIVKLPSSIFNCKTLVVLHLRRVIVKDLSQVIVDLPRLKTLHLSSVHFQTYEYLPKFLSRCPILEELDVKNIILISRRKELVLEENFQYFLNLISTNISNDIYTLFPLCCKAEILHAELGVRIVNLV
jgi:hypothetical protein